ncbi:MAG: FAD-binding oxidoreductase [Xanthomonadales bacterium]|nr:FAD-binding oxidoreductase [Xanthomonadales bacterium]
MQKPFLGRRRFLSCLAGAAAIGLLDSGSARAAGAGGRAVDFSGLAKGFDGLVVEPGHEAYEGARRTASFNPKYDYRPLAIAGCRSEKDIARSILFAREHQLPLSVRSGGHDVLAASVCDDGLVIDTRFLVDAELDPASGLMRIGAGAIAGAVNQAAGQHGRAVALGCNSSVGVSGLTLGGGLGWFVGSHGATCDNVQSARVVKVDGEVVVASESSNPDLFWAIRGGGGNFGVVSEWLFSSHPQGEVVCGGIVFPGHLTAEFLHFYQAFVASSPGDLTVEVIGNAYQEPMVAAAVCYSGEPGGAERALKPLREFSEPLADGLVRRPYAELERMSDNIRPYISWRPEVVENEAEAPGSYWQGTTVPALTEDVIRSIVDAISDAPHGWSFGLGHVMRGACVEVPESGTALLRTPGATTVHFDAGWGHQSQADGLMSWVDEATAAVARLGSATPDYINYLSTNDARSVRDSYGRNFERLLRLKQQYDPDNLLRGNRNIRI